MKGFRSVNFLAADERGRTQTKMHPRPSAWVCGWICKVGCCLDFQNKKKSRKVWQWINQ